MCRFRRETLKEARVRKARGSQRMAASAYALHVSFPPRVSNWLLLEMVDWNQPQTSSGTVNRRCRRRGGALDEGRGGC